MPKFNDWYIHPLNGGNKNIDKNDNNEIVKKIKLYGCLSNIGVIEYYFLLDGDMRKEFENNKSINGISFDKFIKKLKATK